MYQAKALYKIGDTFATPKIASIEEDFLDGWLDRHSIQDDLLLHHYTDVGGLMGILKSKSIWCSEAEFLNDAKEIQYGVDLVKEEIDALEEKCSDVESVSEHVLGMLRTNLNAFPGELYRVFVSCFCESGDLLSQWRGYAQQGGGYALGLRFSEQTRIGGIGRTENKPTLRKIIYDPDLQRTLIRDFLNPVCESVASTGRVYRDDAENSIAWCSLGARLMNMVMDQIVNFKHPGFEEEQEWRLVRLLRSWDEAEENTKFRSVGGLPVPYVVTPIFETKDEDEFTDEERQESRRLFPLHQITYGPTLPQDRTEVSVQSLLKTCGSRGSIRLNSREVSLKPASVPFRG